MEILLKCHSLCDKYQMTLLGMKSGLRDENQASNSQKLDESMNIIEYSRLAGGERYLSSVLQQNIRLYPKFLSLPWGSWKQIPSNVANFQPDCTVSRPY